MRNHLLLEEIAAHYEAALHHDRRVEHAWRELMAETMPVAERLTRAINVVYTPDPEPYPDSYAMLKDLGKGRIIISTAHCDHPVWSLEENCAFRLVHDVVGHGATGSGFDWLGEWQAYEKHLTIVQGVWARRALFTEAIGQVAYALVHGQFTAQKVALLPQWLQWSTPDDSDDERRAA